MTAWQVLMTFARISVAHLICFSDPNILFVSSVTINLFLGMRQPEVAACHFKTAASGWEPHPSFSSLLFLLSISYSGSAQRRICGI